MDRHTLSTAIHYIGPAITVLLLIAGVAALAGGILPPDRAGLPAALAATAQPLIVAALLAATLVATLRRKWRSTFVMAIMLALLTPAALTYLAPGKAAPWKALHPQRTFSVMTFNANGFEFADKALRHVPSESTRAILRHRPDIVILQEPYVCRMVYYDLHSVALLRDSLDALYPYRSIGFDNVMILSRHPFTLRPVEPAELRYTGGTMPRDIFHHFAVVYDVELPGMSRPLRVVGCHLASFRLTTGERSLLDADGTPPLASETTGDKGHTSVAGRLSRAYRLRAAQAKRVRHVVATSTDVDNVVVCGDFNDTPSSYAYRVVADAALRDARADCHIGPITTYNAHHLAVCIDHILYRGDIRPVAYANLHEGNSDHIPQIAVFAY